MTPTHWLVERIRAAAEEQAAFMPVHAEFGVRALDARPGRTEFGQAMGPSVLDRHGLLCPGAFLVAADAALGSAVATTLAQGSSVMSLTLHAQFLTLDPGRATDFAIRAEVIHLGAASGFATGEIVDDRGREIARITIQCGFLEGVPPAVAPMPLSRGANGPSPVEADAHEPSLAPIAVSRTGARLVEGTNGELVVTAVSTPSVRNGRGDLQGGVLGLLAEQAISACLVRNSPALAAAETMELDITYVRPVRASQPDVEITARCEHPGRRFGLAQARGRDGAGRLVVSATGSRYAP